MEVTGAARLHRVASVRTAGLEIILVVVGFRMQFQAKRPDDFKDGVETGATISGKRFV